MLSVALALIPCVVVAFILNEREKQLKHQQLVSGTSIIGYWTANLMTDIIACFIPIIAIMMLNLSFDLQIEYTARFLILYPFAIIPFSYVTSFFFSDEIIA